MIIFLLIVVFIYLFAIMPKISNTPDFTPFMARYYAHRDCIIIKIQILKIP